MSYKGKKKFAAGTEWCQAGEAAELAVRGSAAAAHADLPLSALHDWQAWVFCAHRLSHLSQSGPCNRRNWLRKLNVWV